MNNLNQNGINLNAAAAKKFMQGIKAAGDPEAIIKRMLGNNPRFKKVMEYVDANGGDPQAAFYKLAEEMGVNPDEFIKQMMN